MLRSCQKVKFSHSKLQCYLIYSVFFYNWSPSVHFHHSLQRNKQHRQKWSSGHFSKLLFLSVQFPTISCGVFSFDAHMATTLSPPSVLHCFWRCWTTWNPAEEGHSAQFYLWSGSTECSPIKTPWGLNIELKFHFPLQPIAQFIKKEWNIQYIWHLNERTYTCSPATHTTIISCEIKKKKVDFFYSARSPGLQ